MTSRSNCYIIHTKNSRKKHQAVKMVCVGLQVNEWSWKKHIHTAISLCIWSSRSTRDLKRVSVFLCVWMSQTNKWCFWYGFDGIMDGLWTYWVFHSGANRFLVVNNRMFRDGLANNGIQHRRFFRRLCLVHHRCCAMVASQRSMVSTMIFLVSRGHGCRPILQFKKNKRLSHVSLTS